MQRFIAHTRGKERLVVTVKALADFSGARINRDELGLVTAGQEIQVSENDAQGLELDQLVERVATQESPSEPAESTPPASGTES